MREWLEAVEAVPVEDPDLDAARERINAYAFKKPFREKIEERGRFLEEHGVAHGLPDLITIASSVRAAWHLVGYGEGALVESYLWWLRREEGVEAVIEAVNELGFEAEEYNGDAELIAVNWVALLGTHPAKEFKVVNAEQLLAGETGFFVPGRECPVCGARVDDEVCPVCGAEVPRVEKGKVVTSFRVLTRAVRELVKDIVVGKCEEISGECGDYREECFKLFPGLKERVERARRRAKKGGFPPCMRRLLERAQEGENLPHEARFALAAFLVNVGWEEDRIVEVFSNLPDFDEERTRYQVRHIAGEEGSGTRYLPPNCDKMREWGLCENPDGCGVKNPLVYARRGRPRD